MAQKYIIYCTVLIFTKIFENRQLGAKQEGAVGFFKGVGKGLTGLLGKPVTGIVDATSTAFQGVQSQLEVKEDVNRVRYPRVVHESPLEPYRARLATGCKMWKDLNITGGRL